MVTAIIIATVILIHIFFFIALVKKNFAVIDIGWGLGFILVATLSYLLNPPNLKKTLLLAIVSIWGLRLAIYLLKRSRGKGEDPRYRKLRIEWKPHENLQAYFKVFLFQGFLMLLVSLPVTVAMASEVSSITFLNWTGAAVWLAGLSIEVWSDHYLNQWKARPENKEKICMNGPWSFCRFPNYFGEVLLWYGVFFMAVNPETSWTIVGPVILNFLILKVTGVPPLTEKYMKRPEYQSYAARVPRFIPFTKP